MCWPVIIEVAMYHKQTNRSQQTKVIQEVVLPEVSNVVMNKKTRRLNGVLYRKKTRKKNAYSCQLTVLVDGCYKMGESIHQFYRKFLDLPQ